MADRALPRLRTLFGVPRAVEGLCRAAVLGLTKDLPPQDLACELRVLAGTFAQTVETKATAAEQRRAWHHLLMSVANAKSRAGGLHLGPPGGYLEDSGSTPITAFALPAAAGEPASPICEIRVGDPTTWSQLTDGVNGLTVGSASLVLAAIWPESHAEIDNMALGTLMGLQGMDDEGQPVEGLSIEALNDIWRDAVTGTKDWSDYEWYLATLQETLLVSDGGDLQELQRALTVLGTKSAGFNSYQWPEWSRRLRELLTLAHDNWIASN